MIEAEKGQTEADSPQLLHSEQSITRSGYGPATGRGLLKNRTGAGNLDSSVSYYKIEF